MIALKVLLTVAGVLMIAAAFAVPLYGLWGRIAVARRKAAVEKDPDKTELMENETTVPAAIAWRRPAMAAVAGCVPLLLAAGIVVVPSGMGGTANWRDGLSSTGSRA